ncbi:hypothetical protein GCM10009628_37910 [Paeniglutamicibacter kerguelensis]
MRRNSSWNRRIHAGADSQGSPLHRRYGLPRGLLTQPNREEKADIIAGELGQLQQVTSAVGTEAGPEETKISVTTLNAPSSDLLRQIDDICSSPATRWNYFWGDVWTCTVNGKL